MSKKMKVFLVISGILIVILLINIFSGSNKPAQNSTSSLTTTNGGAVSLGVNNILPNENKSVDEFSDLLSSLRSISIDTTIFSNPNYKALRENQIVLGTDTVGRSDPFAAFGTDSTTPTTSINANGTAPVSVDAGGIPIMETSTVFLVQTLSPDKITATSALLSQKVTVPLGNIANVAFEYGKTTQFGDMTPPIQLNTSGVQTYIIKNLKSKTIYYVRAIGDNGTGSVTGDTMSFTTK